MKHIPLFTNGDKTLCVTEMIPMHLFIVRKKREHEEVKHVKIGCGLDYLPMSC